VVLAPNSACQFGSIIIRELLLVGDRWFGKGRGAAQFSVIYTGEVLGGAFYFDGRLYRDAAGPGGELGHTFVQVGGELCRCGRRGCWDTIATLSWLRREAKRPGLPRPDKMDSGSLIHLADSGDTRAQELADRYAHNIAVGIANVQQTIAPTHFILHGDVALGGSPWSMRSQLTFVVLCPFGLA
jgi:predicted NBD/HSP70 family sugar kinase